VADKKDDHGAGGIYAAQTIAQLLMITVVRLNQLERAGWIQKVSRGKYSIVAAVQGYIRFLKDEARSQTKSASASRVQDARAREIELRTSREEAKLIETEEAISFVDDVLGGMKPDIYSIPARVTRDLDLRRKITTEIDDAFRRAADRYEQEASALRAGGSFVPPVAEDDAG
jgi:hypothetical protein